jgi:sulfite exporter TauE/SafE
MSNELLVLIASAGSLGFIHTILGPDHYIPFIVMSKSEKWSKTKTFWITVISGAGHVAGTVILGLIGILLGIAAGKFGFIQEMRGSIAAWGLISFGIIYLLWGLKRAFRNVTHTHSHYHEGVMHSHTHSHKGEHAHVHVQKRKSNITPWVIFTIFVFGPCEALIPLLIYPAANIGIFGVIAVILVFAAATIGTMTTVVMVSLFGIEIIPFRKFERYSHALAGMVVFLSGVSVQFLGL